jgi:hypothetical protein
MNVCLVHLRGGGELNMCGGVGRLVWFCVDGGPICMVPFVCLPFTLCECSLCEVLWDIAVLMFSLVSHIRLLYIENRDCSSVWDIDRVFLSQLKRERRTRDANTIDYCVRHVLHCLNLQSPCNTEP